jgi:Lrp/AsnC family leucine-responsive transcriptional regulator
MAYAKQIVGRPLNAAELDAIDRSILNALQRDARISRAAIGEEVGLSAAAVHERIRKLERAGVIRGYAALLDAERSGCDLLAFVLVFIEHPKFEARFINAVGRMDEVQECHHVTGTANCLLKVRAHDRQALQTLILDRINALGGVRQTETIVVLSTTKETPRLQLEEEKEEGELR